MADTEQPTNPAVEGNEPEDQGASESDFPLPAASGEVWVDLTEDAQEDEEKPVAEGSEEKPGEPSGAADEGKGSGEEPAEATDEEAREREASEVEGQGPPEPTPSGVASEESGESAEEEPTQPSPETHPFSFKADGTKVDVPGAVVGKAKGQDGEEREYILIPKDSWQKTVQPRVADRVQIQQREANLQRQLDQVRRELDPDHNPDVQRARALVSEFDKILEDEASLRSFLENFEQGKAHLKSRIDNRVLTAEKEGRQEMEKVEATEKQIDEWAETMATDLPQVVDNVLSDDRVKPLLPPQAAELFRNRVLRNAGRFYTVGTEETEKAGGLGKGVLGRNDELLLQELQDVISIAEAMGHKKSAPAQGKKNGQTEAAAKNARALGEGKKPPKTPSPKATSAPASSTDEVPQFKSKEELMAWAQS